MTIKINAKILENYSDYYCEGESEWRRIAAISKAENIVNLCNPYPHDQIIEIGAGEGSILKRLSDLQFGTEYFAVEISPTGVDVMKAKKIPRLVSCEVFDGYSLQYKDHEFDLAILSHVVEHVEHPRQLLYEAKRVAKFVFIEVPLEYTVSRSWNFRFSKVGHINFYSSKLIRWLLQSCNMEILKQKTVVAGKNNYIFREGKKGIVKYYIKKIFLNIAPMIAPSLFTYIAILVCKGGSEEILKSDKRA